MSQNTSESLKALMGRWRSSDWGQQPAASSRLVLGQPSSPKSHRAEMGAANGHAVVAGDTEWVNSQVIAVEQQQQQRMLLAASSASMGGDDPSQDDAFNMLFAIPTVVSRAHGTSGRVSAVARASGGANGGGDTRISAMLLGVGGDGSPNGGAAGAVPRASGGWFGFDGEPEKVAPRGSYDHSNGGDLHAYAGTGARRVDGPLLAADAPPISTVAPSRQRPSMADVAAQAESALIAAHRNPTSTNGAGAGAPPPHSALGPLRAYGLRQARAESFFDAFCIGGGEGEDVVNAAPSPSKGMPTPPRSASRNTLGPHQHDAPSPSAAPSRPSLRAADGVMTQHYGGVAAAADGGKAASSRGSGRGEAERGLDITVLLEGPRPRARGTSLAGSAAGGGEDAREDERRMSTLMDAPITAYAPVVQLEVVRKEDRAAAKAREREEGGAKAHTVAAARHLSVPNSQHTVTLGAMVKMLCTAFEGFDVRLEAARAEEAEEMAAYAESSSAGLSVLPPPPPMESLRPCEVESFAGGGGGEEEGRAQGGSASGVHPAKWRLFDVLLELAPDSHSPHHGQQGGMDGPQHTAAIGMGMAYCHCRVIAHRPLHPAEQAELEDPFSLGTSHPSHRPSPLVAVAKALQAKGDVHVSILLPAAQYYSLSMEAHRFVGLAMPFMTTCVVSSVSPPPSTTAVPHMPHPSPPQLTHVIIVPSLNVLPLPVRTVQGELLAMAVGPPSYGEGVAAEGGGGGDGETLMVQDETLGAASGGGGGFRFHTNPLAGRAGSGSIGGGPPSRSPSRRHPSMGGGGVLGAARSQSRPSVSRMDARSGFAYGPYPNARPLPLAAEGGGAPQAAADDDWHVPIETLDAIVDAFTTQMSSLTAGGDTYH